LALNPETSLRSANRKFENRFRYMEKELLKAGLDMNLLSEEELDCYWVKAKQAEKKN